MLCKIIIWCLILIFNLYFGTGLCINDEPETVLDLSWNRKDNDTCTCGISSAVTSMVNGYQTEQTESIYATRVSPVYKYPWMAAIYIENEKMCAGSIIGPYHILAPANCFLKLPDEDTVVLTCDRFSDKSMYCFASPEVIFVRTVTETGFSEYKGIDAIMFHPGFNLPSQIFDIALLKTKERLPCTDYTAPICLPNTEDKTFHFDSNPTLAGFGLMERGPTESPLTLWEKVFDIEESTTCEIPEMHYCSLQDTKEACYKETCGPLFIKSNGKFYAVALYSYDSDDDGSFPPRNSFLKLNPAIPWIKKTMRSM